MAKKKKLESKAPVPLTRGQLSRAQREQQQIRNLYTAGIILGGAILLVLAFAAISTFIIRPNTELASVNGVKITRATYNKARSWSLYQQIQQAVIQQQFSQQTGGSAVDSGTLSTLMQQLKDVDKETPDQDIIKNLVDSEVLRQKSASELQINPTTDQLKEEAKKDFLPSPTAPPSSETPTVAPTSTPAPPTATPATSTVTPSPTLTRTPTNTATRGTPTATPTVTATWPPVPGAQQTAEAIYSRYVGAISAGPNPSNSETICRYGCPSLSESDYLNIIIDPRVRQNLVTEKLAATGLITDVEQIHAQHILTTTEAGALKIREMLDKGADFTTLANEQSSEQLNNIANGSAPNGGDLGWFPEDSAISNLDQNFVAGAWPVKVGEYSQPVHTSFGFHIIKVLERETRPLTETQITTKKTKLYNDWFQKAKESSTISPDFAKQQPTPTPPPLAAEPTLAPVETPTSAVGPVDTPNPDSLSGGATPTPPAATPTTDAGAARNTPVPTKSP